MDMFLLIFKSESVEQSGLKKVIFYKTLTYQRILSNFLQVLIANHSRDQQNSF